MHTIQLYIKEDLDVRRMIKLKHLIQEIEHVTDVEMTSKHPHEAVIDYEEHESMPMHIVEVLKENGFHTDIFSG